MTSTKNEMAHQQSNDLMNEGNELLKSSKINEAIEKFNEAINLYPHEPLHLCTRAAALCDIGKYELAFKVCFCLFRSLFTHGESDPHYACKEMLVP